MRAQLLAMDGSEAVEDEVLIGEEMTPTALARRLLEAAPEKVRLLFAG
jgi:hypothetical protein